MCIFTTPYWQTKKTRKCGVLASVQIGAIVQDGYSLGKKCQTRTACFPLAYTVLPVPLPLYYYYYYYYVKVTKRFGYDIFYVDKIVKTDTKFTRYTIRGISNNTHK